MAKPLNFQQVILKLHEFWADQGSVIWEPYNIQNGAGTGNPATMLRVLGPEPWRVAYVEPSIRPDDGRYGENPNRMQKFYQYQVILKPDPGNPQELYLDSLKALGINPREHDIRFVEDNWESPALGAWGLGWEVWLDGQEITQYTYFQQAGGIELDPVAVEITYGIERIVLALQDKNSVWEINWMDDLLTYGDIFLQEEIEHCRYYFEIADVDGLRQVYDIYEKEHKRALENDALISAYDYVLKCSHLFNVLDARGAIGVTERAHFFRRMRDMSRTVARTYVAQREALGYPLLKFSDRWVPQQEGDPLENVPFQHPPEEPADVLFEIGVEELPASDVDDALAQLKAAASTLFDDLRLNNAGVDVYATPRRLVIHAQSVAPKQRDVERIEKGPPANRAFDAEGKPTKAGEGFARSRGIDVSELYVDEQDGGAYVMAKVHEDGRYTIEVLTERLPELIDGLRFGKSMRWNHTNIAFSRPIRWILAMFGSAVIPFEYAGIVSGNVTRGLRPYGSPEKLLGSVEDYIDNLSDQNIILDRAERRESIIKQITALASEVDGTIPDDPGLLDEVTNLVESPTALRGTFDEKHLVLPREVLVTVMRKHQRYFPLEDQNGNLLPYFITVRNGDDDHLDKVRHGNEHVLRARFSDADFFYKEDAKQALEDFLPRLGTLTFQEHLGSMLDKNQRVAGLMTGMGDLLGITKTDTAIAERAAHIAKADLATQMVVEMTSLQGVMGRYYALKSGYPQDVADAVYEHWLPRSSGDELPSSPAGTLLAITDRLDSLVGLFAAGLAPKSTADPYGLRRAALGIIEILNTKQIDVNLVDAVELVAAAQPIEVKPEAQAQVLEFIAGRLRVWLSEQGFATDVVNAIIAEQRANPYRAMIGAKELTQWIKREDWANILDNFARCVRITRSEPERYSVDESLFQQEEEYRLYKEYQQAAAQLDGGGNVDAFLTAFAPMVPAITAYFGTGKGDGVLVNTEDVAVRRNRLGLLQAISAMQNDRADLSELSGF